MKPKDLAEQLDMDENRVYEWLNAAQIPRPANLRKLARVLRMPLPSLLASLPIEE